MSSDERSPRAGWAVHWIGALLLALGVASCGLVVSFDSFGTTAPVYSVSGSVDGLRGASIVLRVREATLEVGDGPFLFRESVPPRAPWAVSVAKNPVSHTCTVEQGAGASATEDITGVVVHCPSTDASLRDLVVSAAPLTPAFAAATLLYTTELPALSSVRKTTITATANDASARITVAGISVASGQPSKELELASGANAFDITIVAADGFTKTHYAVLISAQPPDYIKASNTAPEATFGHAVALSGNTLAVGAVGESNGTTGINGAQAGSTASRSGAVYVYTRSGSTWSQQAYIKASNTRSDAEFGRAIALDGDTLAVGSPGESSSSQGIDGDQSEGSGGPKGAVYVFRRVGTTWSQEAYVKASNTSALEGRMGAAVALVGDTLVAADPSESSDTIGVDGQQTTQGPTGLPLAEYSGAVYVFTRTGATWSQASYIKGGSRNSFARFGTAVALSSDTMLVSAPGALVAYVLSRAGATWQHQAVLRGAADEDFGIAVSLARDRAAVASARNTSGSEPHAVYIFRRGALTWSREARIEVPKSPFIEPSIRSPTTYRTQAVALSDDRLVVGAFEQPSNARGVNGTPTASMPGAGTVYVFERSASTWSKHLSVSALDPRPYTWFGVSLAMSQGTLVIGREGDSSAAVGVNGDFTNAAATGSGAVFVY